jgi:hypothetical protein
MLKTKGWFCFACFRSSSDDDFQPGAPDSVDSMTDFFKNADFVVRLREHFEYNIECKAYIEDRLMKPYKEFVRTSIDGPRNLGTSFEFD